MSKGSSSPRGSGKRLATILGLAALIIAVVLLAAVAGAFAVSHCADVGEARTGALALQFDADMHDPRVAVPSSPRRPDLAPRPIRVSASELPGAVVVA